METTEEPKVLTLENTEVKVCHVKVSGLEQTKNDIVMEQVKDILQSHTLQELLVHSLQSVDKLHSLKIFKEVKLQFDTHRSESGNVEGVNVVFNVKEGRMITSSLSANAGTQSGDASLSMMLRNLFGRAEHLQVMSLTAFPHWGQTIRIEFSKPHYSNIERKFNASIATTSYKEPSCGYQQYIVGPKLEFQWPSWLGQHCLAWLCEWRQLYGFDNGVPFEIRHNAGHTMKSSIKNVLETDKRDDPIIPTSGYHSRLTQEVAGLGGDVIFSKAEMQTAIYKELLPNWVLSLSFWCGLLKPFSPSKINDRFFLGGPTTIRGFQMWGVGPHYQGYSYGGEAYWATGLHLFTPLPYTSGELFRRIRLHAFINGGTLTECRHLSQLPNLLRDTRFSSGIGLHCRLGVAQIEINYAVPLRAKSNDRLKPGLQFGIGFEML